MSSPSLSRKLPVSPGIVVVGALLLASIAVPAQGQERDTKIEDLHDRAVPIRTIDPADEDFSDLTALADAIGEARIVQLGESTHGDGSGFAAKARLVKFLHQELGFDVLVWESGMYDLRVVNKSLRSGADAAASARFGVFGIWSGAREVLPLFEYARQSHGGTRPLEMAGMDLQFSGRRIGDLEMELEQFIDKIVSEEVSSTAAELAHAVMDGYRRFILPNSKQREYVRELREKGITGPALADSVRDWRETRAMDFAPTPPDLEQFLSAANGLLDVFEKNRTDIVDSHGQREFDFMERVLGNLREYGITQFERNFAGRPTDDSELLALRNRAWNRRDARMADNLNWLAQVMYPDQKFMVWAHNGHVMNAYYEADWNSIGHEPTDGGMKPMGAFIAEELGDQVYTIAFTAFSGEYRWAARPEGRKIEPMPRESVEGLLHELGHNQVFLDFRSLAPDHWLRRPTTMAIRGYLPEEMDDWTRVVDGIFFIDQMMPATLIGQP